MATTNGPVEEFDVLVVGGGFASHLHSDRLRDLGHTVKVFEGRLGAGRNLVLELLSRCSRGQRRRDLPVLLQGPLEGLGVQRALPGVREVRAYFAYLDKKLDISKDVQFNTRVESADFDTDRNQWVVRCSDGSTVRCSYLVPCIGFAAKPSFRLSLAWVLSPDPATTPPCGRRAASPRRQARCRDRHGGQWRAGDPGDGWRGR